MTPADLRAKAKALRAQSARLLIEADDLEVEAAYVEHQASLRAALEDEAIERNPPAL